MIWSVFILPETLRTSKRAKRASLSLENPIRAMAILFRSQMFVCLTAVIALTAFVSNGLFHIQLFYLNVRSHCCGVAAWIVRSLTRSLCYAPFQTVLGFDEKGISHLMLIGGVMSIVAQVFLLKPLMDCMREKGVIILALVVSILTYICYIVTAFYPMQWIIFAIAIPGSIGELSFAAISSLKSVNVSEKVCLLCR